jgi:hypothetical protein
MDRYVTERRNGPIYFFKESKIWYNCHVTIHWESYGGYKWKKPKNRLKHYLSYASAFG